MNLDSDNFRPVGTVLKMCIARLCDIPGFYKSSYIKLLLQNMPTMGDEVMRNLFQKMALKTTRLVYFY